MPAPGWLSMGDPAGSGWVTLGGSASPTPVAHYRVTADKECLRLRGDGRIALELKRAWHDGTRELVFEPLEFLERPVGRRARRPTCSSAMACWLCAPGGAREWSFMGGR